MYICYECEYIVTTAEGVLRHESASHEGRPQRWTTSNTEVTLEAYLAQSRRP